MTKTKKRRKSGLKANGQLMKGYRFLRGGRVVKAKDTKGRKKKSRR